MTKVRIDLRVPTADGSYLPATGRAKWTPTRRWHMDGTITDFTVLPQPFSVWLTTPPTVVDVAPTGPDWCWRVTEYTSAGSVRYVTVPSSTTTVDYGDLIDLDPATLSQAANPEAAWWVALDQVSAGGGGSGPGQAMYVITWSSTTGWPARPDVSLVPAGRASYRATAAGGATAPLPTDMLDGDELVRRSV